MEGSREAEMIVTFALEGINYACRLSGAFAKNIAAMIAAVAKTPGNSPGKTRMKQLMQSGEPLDYYVVPEAVSPIHLESRSRRAFVRLRWEPV